MKLMYGIVKSMFSCRHSNWGTKNKSYATYKTIEKDARGLIGLGSIDINGVKYSNNNKNYGGCTIR